jgi:hypothetical protein
MRQHNLKVTGSLQINGESVVSASQIVGLESASIHNGNWTASVENNEFRIINDGSNLFHITSGSTEINNGTVTITADSFASDYAEDYTELGDALILKGNGVVSGSFRPATGGIHNLGTLEHPWKELFVSTGSINLVENGEVAFTITADTIVTTDTLTDGNIDLTNSLPVGVVSGSSQIIDILSSLNSYTGSNDTTNTNQNTRLSSIDNITGSLATTGSNTFYGTQVFTGSVYISSNLIVQGSSSLQNITASAVDIGTNKIILNWETKQYPNINYPKPIVDVKETSKLFIKTFKEI